MNLVPLIHLTKEDFETSLLNVLLIIPFGFGLPFITKSTFKKIAIAGLLIGVIIESLQGIVGLLIGFTFRVVDLFKLLIKKANVELNSLLKHIYDA